MPALNQVVLCGNLTRDIEIKYLPSGSAVAEISLAINERVKRGDEWVDEATFVEVTVFGKPAEWLAEDGVKGAAVLVSGRLKLDAWEKDGQKRTKLKIVAEKAQLCEKKQRSGGGQQSAPSRGRSTKPSNEETPF